MHTHELRQLYTLRRGGVYPYMESARGYTVSTIQLVAADATYFYLRPSAHPSIPVYRVDRLKARRAIQRGLAWEWEYYQQLKRDVSSNRNDKLSRQVFTELLRTKRVLLFEQKHTEPRGHRFDCETRLDWRWLPRLYESRNPSRAICFRWLTFEFSIYPGGYDSCLAEGQR